MLDGVFLCLTRLAKYGKVGIRWGTHISLNTMASGVQQVLRRSLLALHRSVLIVIITGRMVLHLVHITSVASWFVMRILRV